MPTRKKREENPERLVRLLRRIRTDVFDCSRLEMANKLNEVERLTNRRSFSAETIKNIENGNVIISYYHVSVYGDLLDIPTGILLLFSRYSVTNLQTDRAFRDFNAILNAFTEINNETMRVRSALTIQDLKDMSEFSRNLQGKKTASKGAQLPLLRGGQ